MSLKKISLDIPRFENDDFGYKTVAEKMEKFHIFPYRGGRGGGRGGYQQRNSYRGGRPDSASQHRDYTGSRTSEVRGEGGWVGSGWYCHILAMCQILYRVWFLRFLILKI